MFPIPPCQQGHILCGGDQAFIPPFPFHLLFPSQNNNVVLQKFSTGPKRPGD